jgi:kinesin family protein 18/19
MIVCVAPTSAHLEDTGNTLAYANRAKEIKTKVSKNIMDVDRHVGQYVEAINRLNDEVRELKAKLAGEVALDNEATKRRRSNAAKAVEAARNEIKALATKSKTMLCTGSFTAGNTAASHAKLDVIRARLKEIEAGGELTSDLETEKSLLTSVAAAEEEVIKKEADALARASNTAAMFTTNVGLAQKRKGGEDWDESAPALLKMEGDVVLAEMRAARAEQERDGLKMALGGQAKVVTALIGMLARTNTLVGDGARMLNALSESNTTPGEIAARLQALVEINDKSFGDIIGVSTNSVAPKGKAAFTTLLAPPLPSAARKRTSLTSNTSSRPRTSVGSRRTSLNGLASPGRRGHGFKSPRKQSAMRQSVGKSHKAATERKSVRWAVPINPDSLPEEPVTPTPKVVSLPAVEQEWEDDRADDSSTSGATSFSGSSSLSLDAAALSWSSSSTTGTGRRTKNESDGLGSKTILPSLKEENEPTPRRTVFGDYNATASTSKARRRSNVGPTRSDRPRRRSSLIPQLSPRDKNLSKPAETSSQRKSPKKPKRSSLLGALTSARMIRPSLLKIGVEAPTGPKPTWK